MKLYVHSAGRATVGQQVTLKEMTPAMRKGASLVVQHAQRDAYAPVAKELGTKLLVLPPGIDKLSPTRQWLLENAEKDKFAMMDDDLFFAVRLDSVKFRVFNSLTPKQAQTYNITDMMEHVESMLDAFIHVGILDRSGANRVTEEPYVEVKRMMRFLAYRKKAVLKTGARFDRLVTKQDFDMTLQLLRAGYPNAVLTTYVQDQRGGSNTKGGCSVYRTEKTSEAAAHALAKLHPRYVKVVEKTTKSGWFDKSQPGTRTDVQIAWKKAFEEQDHAR